MDFLLNIPLLSILLLVAGVLLGHMIWGRGQAEDAKRMGELQESNSKLQNEIGTQNSALGQLESSLESHRRDSEQLRETSRQLEETRAENSKLSASLQVAENNVARVQTLTDKLQSHVGEFHKERDQFVDAVQIRLEEQSKQIERLSHERDEVVAKLGKSQSECSGLVSKLNDQANELSNVREKYAQSSAEAGEVVKLRTELEKANAECIRETHQREHLQSVLDGRKIEYDALMQDIEKLESSFQKMCLQNEKLTEESSLLGSLRVEHEELNKQNNRLQKTCDSLSSEATEVKSLRIKVSDQTTSIANLVREKEALEETRLSFEKHVSELEADLQQRVEETKQVREEHTAVQQRLDATCSEKDALDAVLQEASAESNKLKEDIVASQKSRASLEQELHEMKGQYSEAVKSHAYAVDECDELITTAERAEQRVLKLEQQLEALENVQEARDSDLGELREKHAQATEAVESLEKDIEDLNSKYQSKCGELSAMVASRDEVSESFRDSQEEVLNLKRQIVDAESERSRLDEMTVTYSEQIDVLKNDLETQRDENAIIADKLEDSEIEILRLTKEVDDIASSRGEVDSSYNELKTRFDAQAADLSEIQHAKNEVVESYKSVQEDLLQMDQQLAEARQLRAGLETRVTDLQISLSGSDQRVAELVQTAVGTETQIRDSDSVIQNLRDQIEELRTTHGSTDADLAAMRVEYEDKARELKDAVDARRELVATNQDAEEKITRLEVKVQQLEKIRTETNSELVSLREKLTQVGDLKRNLADQNRRMEVLVAERDSYAKSKSAVELRIEQLESELERQSKSFSDINQQHEQLRSKLKLESEKYALAAAELEAQRARVEALENELEEFEALKQEHVELQTQLTSIKDRLRKLSDERDEHITQRRTLERQVSTLQNHNVTNEDTIRDLRRERMAVIERLRNRAMAAQASTAELKVVRYAAEHGPTQSSEQHLRHDADLGNVYTQAPDEVDDLKAIYGIAQVLEGKLNEFGVYTYRQIMEWDEATVEAFSERLAFKDRIQRDGWILQAQRLHEEKYGVERKVA